MDNLSRYTFKRKINSGGMATVYLAEDTLLKRDVAIKKVHPHLLERPEAIRRFNNEAKIIASLSHENIVTVFDYGESENERYLVMEYVNGLTLVDLVEKYDILPNLILLDIITQVLSGLKAAHSKGIYHRDIKPDNVMVDYSGDAHIMDFGIAYLVNQESITLTGSFVGSPSYISPEQVVGDNLTEKSDIFSFGSLCYVCATNVLPFYADNPNAILHKVVNEEPLSPFKRNTGLLQWLSDFIEKCLQKEPEKRPDVKECITLIENMCDADGIVLDRNRYSQFINDPEGYRLHENKELYKIYQKNATENYQNKKFVAVLKNLDQMRVFGELTPEDLNLLQKIKNRGKIRSILALTGIVSVIFVVFFLTFKYLSTIIDYQSDKSVEKRQSDSLVTGISAAHAESIVQTKDSVVQKTAIPPAVDRIKTKQVRPKKRIPKKEDITSAIVYGYLDLRTNPPWVKVIIDDIKIGETPKTGIIRLKQGEHRLILEKRGFQKIDYTITIEKKDTLQKKIMMKPQ